MTSTVKLGYTHVGQGWLSITQVLWTENINTPVLLAVTTKSKSPHEQTNFVLRKTANSISSWLYTTA